MKTNLLYVALCLSWLQVTPNLQAAPTGTAFTYQGRLTDGGQPAQGPHDLRFTLHNAATGGSQVGEVRTLSGVAVESGVFTVPLDFGAGVFDGAARWVEAAVRKTGVGGYTTLSPRQPLTPAPYAQFALTPAGPAGATGATGATGPAGPQGPPGPAGSADAWSRTGNSGTSPGTEFIGTTDDQRFEIHVNGQRVLGFEHNQNAYGSAPNVIGGSAGNVVGDNLIGVTIAGGGRVDTEFLPNQALHQFTTVSGGIDNTSSGFGATVCGGAENISSGLLATVCGGGDNSATGNGSFAAGYFARANHDFSFVWSGRSYDAPSFADERFHVHGRNGLSVDYSDQRPDGGGVKWIVIGSIGGQAISTSLGAWLSDGGVWVNASDRDRKDGFADVNAREILEKVAALPIQTWHYTNETAGIRHLGPVAQDFRASFGLGSDDKSIGTVDADGVALAAIQGLNRKLEKRLQEKDARITALEQSMTELKELVHTLAREKGIPR